VEDDAARAGGSDLSSLAFGSPLATWFRAPRDVERFRRRTLGRVTRVLPPHDQAWRAIAPGFDATIRLARAGVPFQTAVDRRYDRTSDPRALPRALREGRTIFFPQVHQVLPRLARLMVALRVALLGGAREECSFLFAVEGQGREGMGLHHDGNVDAFWLQLEGRRTVTTGPPVPPRTPLDLPASRAFDSKAWRTIDLTPGTLFHLPPRTPHRVVCHGRSLAISMTWARPTRRGGSARADAIMRRVRSKPDASRGRARGRASNAAERVAALAAWDVVEGTADAIPRTARDRLWVQVPVIAGPIDRRRHEFALLTADGAAVRLPASTRRWASTLATMPSLRRHDAPAGALEPLLRSGILAPVDLPLVVRPQTPRALDGWRFA